MVDPRDLEREIGGWLRRLPPPTAPSSLLPRVMAATAAGGRAPWYSRAWLTWPAGLQIASVVLLAAVSGGLWWGLTALPPLGSGLAVPELQTAAAQVSTAARLAQQAATLGRTLWNVFVQPLAAYFALLAALSALGCAAAYAALTRLALGEAQPQ